MYTQCPYCQTCFRVADAHLKAAKGKVRCGSCKEIFDATEHLYEGVPSSDNKIPVKPPATKPQTPATPKPAATSPEPTPRYNQVSPGGPEIPEEEHEHIDLSTPPERSSAPDQSQFMESIVGEYSRYNNLDEMGSIKIPGAEDLTDSIIKQIGEPEENISIEEDNPEAKEEIAITNLYEDTDSLEEPATTQERDGINALYSAADNQMFEDESSEQLNKDIEALLGDDFDFDDETPAQPKASAAKGEIEQSTKKTAGFSGMDSVRFNIDADIPLNTGDEPKLVPSEKDIEPLDKVSSEDIWSNKQSAVPEKQKPASKIEAGNKDKNDIEFGDSFLDLESSSFKSEGELEFEEEIALPEPEFETEAEIDQEPEPEVVTSTEPQSIEDDLPSFEHDIPRALRSSFENYESPVRPIGLTIAMVTGIIILVITFFTQVVLFRSYQLANQVPALEPMLTALCNALPCRYSGSIDLNKIEVLNRDMRSHPTQKNALLVSAAIVNKAKFDQPYPIIAIKLFDLSGDTVATRYFKPSEYLENLYSKFLLMESGTPVHITLAILDPGDDAVNFEISFK
jgi:predicted Zn finger-like uncharacterized protein